MTAPRAAQAQPRSGSQSALAATPATRRLAASCPGTAAGPAASPWWGGLARQRLVPRAHGWAASGYARSRDPSPWPVGDSPGGLALLAAGGRLARACCRRQPRRPRALRGWLPAGSRPRLEPGGSPPAAAMALTVERPSVVFLSRELRPWGNGNQGRIRLYRFALRPLCFLRIM
ncbi:hypothetical protein PVAP13_1NG221414 [Panicum virgatum]|uniref:Uncharacterized protein n=1 Tax=Panicum virgatum TaxID=38727 RepID=A0A8T0WSM2_PANVG|nr:hypothetical protein PVAP13_1NG221414 [Panicum virgatum]